MVRLTPFVTFVSIVRTVDRIVVYFVDLFINLRDFKILFKKSKL